MLTLARDLKRRKARERHGLFVAEGVRTVEELLASPLNVRGVLVSDQVERTARGVALLADVQARGLELLRVSDSEFESAADTEQSQGVLAIAEFFLPRDWPVYRMLPLNDATTRRTKAFIVVLTIIYTGGIFTCRLLDLYGAEPLPHGHDTTSPRSIAVAWERPDAATGDRRDAARVDRRDAAASDPQSCADIKRGGTAALAASNTKTNDADTMENIQQRGIRVPLPKRTHLRVKRHVSLGPRTSAQAVQAR